MPRHIGMRVQALVVFLALAASGCNGSATPSNWVSPGTDAIEVCGPPCALVERPEEVSALVKALNAGGEGYTDCSVDQQIYTVRFREDARWTEPATVPAGCGSTQQTAKPYKITDEARDMLGKVAATAR
jgi:hypothetical protein